jgi:hypothetical protein
MLQRVGDADFRILSMLGNPLDRPGQLRLVHAARRRSIDPTCLTGDLIYFPRKITNATLSTFRPAETTPRFTQEGFSAGFVDRLIVSGHAVLESTLAARTFEVDPKTQGELPMVSAATRKTSSIARSATSGACSSSRP